MFPADFNIEILFDKYVNLVLTYGWYKSKICRIIRVKKYFMPKYRGKKFLMCAFEPKKLPKLIPLYNKQV